MRTWVSMSVALCSLVLGLVLATCGPDSGSGVGDASVRLTPGGGTEQVYNYDSSRSEIQVTPPAGGVFTATFTYQDPAMSLSIRANGNSLREGDQATFPLRSGLTSSDLLLTLTYGGRSYSSDGAGVGGDLTVEVLRMTEDAVDFRASFNVTLVAQDASTVALVGFLEAHEGDTTGADAGR